MFEIKSYSIKEQAVYTLKLGFIKAFFLSRLIKIALADSAPSQSKGTNVFNGDKQIINKLQRNHQLLF